MLLKKSMPRHRRHYPPPKTFSRHTSQVLPVGSSVQSSGGSGYMSQIADPRTRLAQAAAEEEQACVKLDMSRRELGELEKRWKAVGQEAGQGERDIKAMQAEVESLWKKADGTGTGHRKGAGK